MNSPYDDPQGLVHHIKSLLSGVFDDGESMMPVFLEAYYEWLESEGNAGALIQDLQHMQDVDYKPERYYEYFHEQYMGMFPYDIASDKIHTLKNIRDLYRSKGTEPSIRMLFRILFDEEIEIEYPSEYLLKPSDGDWDEEKEIFDSDRGMLSNDYVLQDGERYQQYSYVIKSTRPFEEYESILKKTVHPAGIRVEGEQV